MKTNIISLILTAGVFMSGCSGSSGGDGGVAAKGEGNPGVSAELDFGKVIDESQCRNPFFGNRNLKEEFINALQFGEVSCVNKALHMGINPNNKIKTDPFSDRLESPIHFALTDGSLFFAKSETGQSFALVKALVDAGADVNVKNGGGETVFQVALKGEAAEKYSSVAKFLIQSKKVNIEDKDARGNTPLIAMINAKNIELIDYLLQYGADHLAKTNQNETTLQLAIGQSLEDLAVRLVSLGVDPAVKDPQGSTGLHRAIGKRMEALTSAIIIKRQDLVNEKDGAGDTPLILALRNQSSDSIQKLLDSGANVELASASGETALFATQDLNHAQLLLNKKANVNHLSLKGESVLSKALKLNSQQLALIYIQAGADVQWLDTDKSTLLHIAIGQNNVEGARTLISRGVDVNATNAVQESALFRVQSVEAISLLLAEKANINQVNVTGQNTFFKVAMSYLRGFNNADSKVMTFNLLNSGSNPNLGVDGEGKSILHYAAAVNQNSLDIMQLIQNLLEKGASVISKDSAGNTALHSVQTEATALILLKFKPDLKAVNKKGETAKAVHESRAADLDFRINLLEKQIGQYEQELIKHAPDSQENRDLKNQIAFLKIQLENDRLRYSEETKIASLL